MNENLNLCEILKGHEGETFYSPLVGDVTLFCIFNDNNACIECHIDSDINGTCSGISFYPDGRYIRNVGECMLFPSKNQRDWNKWLEEQKPKVPKTWSECIIQEKGRRYHLSFIKKGDGYCTEAGNTPIEKSALALLKIHQLIEVGYGGNITNGEWDSRKEWFVITCYDFETSEIVLSNRRSHIAFHTREQAEEFLSHPENVQLLKDYFMVHEMFS